ncbi:sporulation protein rmd1 [Elasticomyces elasticus]|nr:sporulation protein rmd1 [Elasticomyces elasticus]
MRGGTVKSIIGELLGRREGIAYGKGGSMHMFAQNFFGGNGIVGAQVPVGTGIAFAHQFEDKKTATISLYGDGASNQGQVFEAFNMAKLWKLPCIFACENNKYGMGTSAARSSAITEYYKRGQYIPGLKINAMDVLAVKAATEYGKQYTTSGNGPLVFEFVTYRYGGHSMSDPGTTYRTREEIQRMRSTNDPIAGLKTKILDWEVCTEDELKQIDKQARSDIDAEVAEAEKMAVPENTTKILYEDIYVRGSEPINVTFNPLTQIASQPGHSSSSTGGSLRPAYSPSAALASGSNVQTQKEPLLSAFNSKLRRRNSHGATLPSFNPAGPSAPRIGAQRRTKTTEKLKILPNPDYGDGPDEESGRDVYAQFTKIKDPTARRDAARLGKADRDRLPRVTAYCTAQGYRLEGIMKFMKSRAKTRGANPKLFDECLYSPYDYDYISKRKQQEASDPLAAFKKSVAGRSNSRSPVEERLAKAGIMNPSPRLQAGERRFSDSAIEVEEHGKEIREQLIDLQEELGEPEVVQTIDEDAVDPTSADTAHALASLTSTASRSQEDLTHRHQDELHDPSYDKPNNSSSEINTHVDYPEVFVYDYGTVVIWGMTPVQEQRFLSDMSKFIESPLPAESIQTEDFNFYYTREYQARIYNDFISLRDPHNSMIKLAISHALSQSVKTSLFEDLVSDTIETTSPLPAVIAQTGRVNLTRRQLNMQIGELFILRINIHLQGSVLDSPELMWSEPHLEPVYAAVRRYLEIEQRVGLLTDRLDVISDLLAVLREQGSRRHDEILEWIIIVLIAAEIVVAAINILVDLYAGVD